MAIDGKDNLDVVNISVPNLWFLRKIVEYIYLF